VTFEYGLHPYWHGRGYTPDVAVKFNIGWCNWVELKGRLTISIFDEKRNLVSVQGRATDERLEPKYLFMDGTVESAKLTLYNYQHARIRGMERGWIGVVEGATDVWRAHQYGYHNFLSTLSTSVTNRQLELLVRTELNVVDRKSTRLNSSHVSISYAVFCLKKKKKNSNTKSKTTEMHITKEKTNPHCKHSHYQLID